MLPLLVSLNQMVMLEPFLIHRFEHLLLQLCLIAVHNTFCRFVAVSFAITGKNAAANRTKANKAILINT